MHDIIFFSTTLALTNMIKHVQAERGLSYPVYEDMIDKALRIAQDEVAKGTKVVVSRGGTAEFLKEHLSVPVIPVQHSFYDIHTAVQQAKQFSKKIGVIGYESLCDAAENYRLVMNEDICIARIYSHNEYYLNARKMVKAGVGSIIGGHGLRNYEKELSFVFVPGGGSERSVQNAIDEALVQLRLEKERQQQQANLNAVINSISEGIIGFYNDGRIIYINDVAKRLLEYRSEENIQALSPFLDKKLKKISESGSLNGELIRCKHRMLALTTAPIYEDDQRVGTVAMLQEQDYIQMVDRKIRKELIGRGHVAKSNFGDIVCKSTLMNQVKEKAKRYARSDSTILIMGETGVGKEIFAQSIHNYSNRNNKPFVAINCAALPHDIMESELFGYVKGAFTGARSEGKMGIFELAHTGTVFLDEISELSLDVQAKLLRVLQEKEINRVGDDKTIPVDVRIIAACNADLQDCVERKTFRQDLYYRIAVLELPIPPLRDRRKDIPVLVQELIQKRENWKIKKVTPEAMDYLVHYDWPGNVRQLINILERLNILCDGEIVDRPVVESVMTEAEFYHKNRSQPTQEETNWLEEGMLLEKLESELIQLVLRITNGNREKAAGILGISTTTLWRKIKDININ